MSKRLTIMAVPLLPFEGVMIPGEPIINEFIMDLTYNSVNEGHLK